jgi:hypothetical protein
MNGDNFSRDAFGQLNAELEDGEIGALQDATHD